MAPPGARDAGITSALSTNKATLVCRVTGIINGSFTEPGKQEAVASAACAESHADNYGSTILLSKESDGRWQFRWREPGLITRHCTGFRLSDRRDGLLCVDFYSHMGSREQYLYWIDLSKPARQRVAMLVSIEDTMLTGLKESTEANIERVDLGPPLTVVVRYGKVSLPDDVREKNVLAEVEPADIATDRYRLEYTFDGIRFRPTESTDRILKLIKH